MDKHETVRMMTHGQTKDLGSAILQGLPNLTFDQAEFWLSNKTKLAAEIRKIFKPANPYSDLIADWEKFYQDIGIGVDFSDLVIPVKQNGFDRLIIEADGLTPQKVYNICSGLFKCWKWTKEDLDSIITHSDRVGLNAVWVKETVEADENLKNLSADQLEMAKIAGITFNERGLYEAKYFKETGKHLDIKNWTLCSGSRSGGGLVPSFSWFDFSGVLYVSSAYPSSSSGCLRSRQAVS